MAVKASNAARKWAEQESARQQEKFETLTRKKPDLMPLPDFDGSADTSGILRQIDARAAYLEKVDIDVRAWEKKTAKAAEAQSQSRAAQIANELATSHQNVCVAQIPDADPKLLQAVVDALKQQVNGPIFLAGRRGESVALVAYVPAALTSKFQANKIMQQIAPMVAGKGGGRPELAQGSGKDTSKIDIALTEARKLLG